jgi:hypothetical protein
MIKDALTSTAAFLISLVGLIIGIAWAIDSRWDWEPILVILISLAELLFFAFHKVNREEQFNQQTEPPSKDKLDKIKSDSVTQPEISTTEDVTIKHRDSVLDMMKLRYHILFIDDDRKFNVVKILRDTGWKHTKTIPDIKSLDLELVKNTDVFFVDINGVGKLLDLEYEGLDLALMLKQRYIDKKVVIYSANKNFNSFHPAWDECDYKLEKNALPYQFQNLVEEYSIQKFADSR